MRIDRIARRNQAPPPGSTRKSKAPPKKPDITFEQQVAYFMTLYPVGFEDESYIKSERGEAGGKGREKLKDAAIERAEDLLSQKNLDELIGEHKLRRNPPDDLRVSDEHQEHHSKG